jgi:glycosyltransferase involved in cell wall biosynthesis/O-antigen ligase
LWALLAAGTFLAGLSLFQAATHTYDNSYLGLAQAEIRQIVGLDHNYRAGGPVGDANFYALLLTALLPTVVWGAFRKVHPVARSAAVICGGVLVAAFVLTYSRGALVAVAVALLLWLAVAHLRRLVLLGILLLIATLIVVAPRNYLERVSTSTLANDTIQTRIRSQQVALNVFMDHPLFGTGTESYTYIYQDYATRLGLGRTANHIHNTYLAIAAESGLAGLIPFVGALVLILYRAWRRRAVAILERDTQTERLVLTCVLALSTYLIGMLFLPVAYPRYLWLLAGLTMAVGVAPHDIQATARSPRSTSRRLRVMQLIDSLTLGGAEQLVVTLAGHIDRSRSDVLVCSLHSTDESSFVPRTLRSMGIHIHVLGGRRRWAAWHVLRLAWLVWRHDIDVVHTHLPYATTVGVLAAGLVRRPVVTTLHNIAEVRPPAGWNVYRLAARALRLAHLTIACAPEIGAEAVTGLGLPGHSVRIVPNAVDPQRFDEVTPERRLHCRQELLEASAGPLIVSVGNLLPGKGHQYLVEAVPHILTEYAGAHVAIVGRAGSNEPLVRDRIAWLGLTRQVRLCGQRLDIPEVMSAADVIVLPSLWEGLPLVMLEAMVAGRPIVATSVGGISGALEDGVNGRLVRPGDAEGLATAILELLREPALAARMGQNARARVLSMYSAGAWAARLQAIYSEVATTRIRNAGAEVPQVWGENPV